MHFAKENWRFTLASEIKRVFSAPDVLARVREECSRFRAMRNEERERRAEWERRRIAHKRGGWVRELVWRPGGAAAVVRLPRELAGANQPRLTLPDIFERFIDDGPLLGQFEEETSARAGLGEKCATLAALRDAVFNEMDPIDPPGFGEEERNVYARFGIDAEEAREWGQKQYDDGLRATVERLVDETEPILREWLCDVVKALAPAAGENAAAPAAGENAAAPAAEAATVPDEAKLSATELAVAFGVPEEKRESLRKRLDRFRKKHFDSWIENTEAPRGNDRYNYHVKAVRSVVESLLSGR